MGNFGGGNFPSAPAPRPAGSPGGSPYAPPAFGAPGQAPRSAGSAGRSPAIYIINGVLFLLWGLLMVLGSCLRGYGLIVVMTTMEIPGEAYPRLIGLGAGAILGLLLGIVMIAGGLGMAMRNNLGGAKAATIIAAIPCFGCLVCPFGIWSCCFIFDEQSKRDFGVR